MAKKFKISRQPVLDLEYIRSEMELSRNKALSKNKDFITDDIDNKINMVADVQEYICELHELIEKMSKVNVKNELLTDKLTAELLTKNK